MVNTGRDGMTWESHLSPVFPRVLAVVVTQSLTSPYLCRLRKVNVCMFKTWRCQTKHDHMWLWSHIQRGKGHQRSISPQTLQTQHVVPGMVSHTKTLAVVRQFNVGLWISYRCYRIRSSLTVAAWTDCIQEEELFPHCYMCQMYCKMRQWWSVVSSGVWYFRSQKCKHDWG